ncbi:NADH-dependent [FeFe] hydrogenase, group A6 [Anaerovorax odorimutans]|uniref:NADH-dependent [FeFe] hydrogenase, group A6 n=1 Tax=Anaerovorax odorimutans TaxID=109327 RepID=UPI0003FBCD3B|nr:NADH-dependent [FeFe] hydrogenase, group A6 [Anaerovorax odorimutans]
MKTCTLSINNKQITVPEETTILEAAKKLNINIPTLCYHPDQKVKANCRICLVHDKSSDKFVTACSTKVTDGAEILTNTQEVRDLQKGVLELIIANHPNDCLNCIRSGSCSLQDLCRRFNINNSDMINNIDTYVIDNTSGVLVRDRNKCIKCMRCVEVCQETQMVGVLSPYNRSVNTNVGAGFNTNLDKTLCTFCGQCSSVCPVGAIYENDETEKAWEAINDPNKHVVVQVAPAVRVALGDELGISRGEEVTGKMITALRMLGFDKVFDTNFTADLTILEEGNELLHRIKTGGTLPLITSCSPGWINYAEGFFPDLLEHVSTCKSPQQMFGAVAKTYYAKKMDIDPAKVFVISIMPCTAKKFEAARPDINSSGFRDVDVVLTTRELTRMIKSAGIDFADLEDEEFDTLMGTSTGAAVIFGATGGVMEAALRTVYEKVTGEILTDIDFHDVRGFDGIKEATVDLAGTSVKVAVAHGLSNAYKLMEEVKKGNSEYAFIEIMACTGGCLGGGGQPVRSTKLVKARRMDSIYRIDREMPIRKSHENPEVIQLYEDFLGNPNSHLAHELLHTHYKKRSDELV